MSPEWNYASDQRTGSMAGRAEGRGVGREGLENGLLHRHTPGLARSFPDSTEKLLLWVLAITHVRQPGTHVALSGYTLCFSRPC